MDGTIIIGVLILLIIVFIFIRATQNEPRIQLMLNHLDLEEAIMHIYLITEKRRDVPVNMKQHK